MSMTAKTIGLKELSRHLGALPDDLPDMKRNALEVAGQTLLRQVRSNIAGSRIQNAGAVAGWQECKVGEGGGYVAVHGQKEPVGTYTKRNGMEKSRPTGRSITHWLEQGHRTRPPNADKDRIRSNLRHGKTVSGLRYVSGLHFYGAVDVEQVAEKAGEDIMRRVKEELDE